MKANPRLAWVRDPRWGYVRWHVKAEGGSLTRCGIPIGEPWITAEQAGVDLPDTWIRPDESSEGPDPHQRCHWCLAEVWDP